MKIKHSVVAGIGVIFAAALIAGCGGGSQTSALVSPAATSAAVGPTFSNQTTPLTITVQIPPAANTASYRRNPAYVSPSTAYITARANPSGTGGSGSCTSGTCTITINAPVTTTSISVSLYQQCCYSNLLSMGTQAVSLVAGTANTVNMTFDGVVSRLVPTASVNQFVIGVVQPVTVTLTAYDAANNQILPPGNLVDANGNVYVGGSGSPQNVTLAAQGVDASYLTLGALAWNSATYTLAASGTFNDGGNAVQSSITLAPQTTSSAAPAALTPLSIPVNPKSIQVIADPAHPAGGAYTVQVGSPAVTTTSTVEIGVYPTPSPQNVYLAVISNFNDAGRSLTVNNDSCEAPGFSYQDPNISASFPAPMPAGLSYPFMLTIAGPSPSGNPNVRCSFQINDAFNSVSAIVNIGLDNPTLIIQGKKRR